MARITPITVIEAALLVAGRPMTVKKMQQLFEPELTEAEVMAALMELQKFWQSRALELTEVSGGWRFQSSTAVRDNLRRLENSAPAKYAPSIMQTLAVIAWRQPVTRGDIEEIRGGAPHPDTYKRLLDRGWIEVVGRRDTLGRPELFGTTQQFLDDLGLKSLADLPPIEVESAGQEEFELSDRKQENADRSLNTEQ